MDIKPTFISQDVELLNVIPLIELGKVIGLDTEFERRTTFFPKPALLQLQIDSQCFIIDPTTCENLNVFFESLGKACVLMHACREDLEVFRILSEKRIGVFFDTQIAASLLGFDAQISYQNLVLSLLDVELSKSETCSDWLQRPLSEGQVQYAADDVVYLEEINNILREKLKDLGREDWYEQEMSFLRSLINEPTIEDYFYKFKGLGRLDNAQKKVAYDLVIWRESLARERDIPRGFIIKDKGLLEIIKCVGSIEIDSKLLHSLDAVPSPFVRRYGDKVSSLVSAVKTTTQSEKAIRKVDLKLPDSSKSVAKLLKKERDILAEKLTIKPAVLLSNRLLDQVLNFIYFEIDRENPVSDIDGRLSSILNPWRYAEFKNCLASIINKISV